jgi:hypothetical protein
MSEPLIIVYCVYLTQIKHRFANAEALLLALEQAARQYGELHIKERADEYCELILYAHDKGLSYLYQCDTMESLKRRQALELVEDMYDELDLEENDWDDDDDWDEEEEWQQPIQLSHL